MMINAFTSGSVPSFVEDTFCFDNFAHTNNTTNIDAEDAFFQQPPSSVVQDNEFWAPPVFATDEELYLFASSGADFDLTSTPQIHSQSYLPNSMNTTTTTPSSPNSSSEDDNTPMTPPRENNVSHLHHQANHQVITTSTIDEQLHFAYDKQRTTTQHHYGTTNYHYYNNSIPVIASEDLVVLSPPQQLPIQLHSQTVPPQIQLQIPPQIQPTLNTSISTTTSSVIAQDKKLKKSSNKRQDDDEYCQDEHEPIDDEEDEDLDEEDNDYDYASKSKSQKKKQKRVTSNSRKASSATTVCAHSGNNGGCNSVTGGEQAECCIVDCTNAVTNRLRFSLRCHKGNEFKMEYLNCGWNKVCHYHYFSDLYKYKKSLSKTGSANNEGKKSKKNDGKKKKRSRDSSSQLDDSQSTMVASALDVQNFSLIAPVDSADLKKSLRGRNMRSAKRRQLE